MLSGMYSNWKKLWIILVIAMVPHQISAQDVEAKLAQRADFTPTAASVREQLIQVAQHYKIPMGIEWVLQPEGGRANSVAGEASTVMALLNSILQSTPNYSITVRNGVANVSYAHYAADSRNFLNLRIGEFNLDKANVFDAEAELQFKIRRRLHPERFAGGTNGGYGYGVPDENGLDVQNISFSGKDLTVRDILERIVLTNGNTLWLVDIAPSRMMNNEPFFAQFDANQERDFFGPLFRSANQLSSE
jgi:hypothetical protein